MRLDILELEGFTPWKTIVDADAIEGTFLYNYFKKHGLEFEVETQSALLGLLANNKKTCFINIGANISVFPMLLGAYLGNKIEIHTFEPTPDLFQKGKNFASQTCKNLTAHDIALADTKGTATFYLSNTSDTSSSLNKSFRPSNNEIKVNVSTVDDLFVTTNNSEYLKSEEQENLNIILLIDTESTEPDVLKGAKEFIQKYKPSIILEVLPGRTEDDIDKIFTHLGYYKYRLKKGEVFLEEEVYGDTKYESRDWLFTPVKLTESIQKRYNEIYKSLESEYQLVNNISLPQQKSLMNNLGYIGTWLAPNYVLGKPLRTVRHNFIFPEIDFSIPNAYQIEIKGYCLGGSKNIHLRWVGYAYPKNLSGPINCDCSVVSGKLPIMGQYRSKNGYLVLFFEGNNYYNMGDISAQMVAIGILPTTYKYTPSAEGQII